MAQCAYGKSGSCRLIAFHTVTCIQRVLYARNFDLILLHKPLVLYSFGNQLEVIKNLVLFCIDIRNTLQTPFRVQMKTGVS